jgi:hypothetical protein
MTEDAVLTEEAQSAFDKAMEGLVGVNYTPLALLGTQLVSGTNYSFLCEAAVVYPDAQPYYAVGRSMRICRERRKRKTSWRWIWAKSKKPERSRTPSLRAGSSSAAGRSTAIHSLRSPTA